jgi:hypothetical protein
LVAKFINKFGLELYEDRNYYYLSELFRREYKKNGKKINKKQNYCCKDCGRQFIGDHALTYKGCHSKLKKRIELMLVLEELALEI